jgi:hypothetical protein
LLLKQVYQYPRVHEGLADIYGEDAAMLPTAGSIEGIFLSKKYLQR